MINDHDRCEWVMYLLVLAHPGCPRQSPESCKMVVVVNLSFAVLELWLIQH